MSRWFGTVFEIEPVIIMLPGKEVTDREEEDEEEMNFENFYR